MLDFGFYNMDCMDGMKEFPDKYFDLAIVDPVYGEVTGNGYTTGKYEKQSHHIWECACGEGHLSKVLEKHGYDVFSTDLIDRGYGIGGVDFFEQTEKWHGDIVTNPPYRYAQEFIEHALSLLDNGNKLCMFLKVQFLEGKKRKKLYEENPPKRVWVSRSRIKCSRNGAFYTSSMIAYAWYIWEKGYKGDTVLKWFN